MIAALPLACLLAQGPPPMPVAAINAAKNAKAKVETAQQKNSEALVPPPGPAAPAAGQPPAPQPPAPQPAPAPQPGQPGQPAAAPPAPPQSEAAYSYDPQGRRDPFVSLLNQGAALRPAGATRPTGLSGLLIGEISVKGIFKTKSGYLALVQGSDTKTYIAHAGDHVLDGTVKSIVQDAIVFSQDVNDPLSTVKQREVRKSIRQDAR